MVKTIKLHLVVKLVFMALSSSNVDHILEITAVKLESSINSLFNLDRVRNQKFSIQSHITLIKWLTTQQAPDVKPILFVIF